jgi:hypothetical protein
MKTNYQTQNMKLIFLLTLFVILFQSCSKEPDLPSGNPITKYEYLSAGALNQTPYFTNPDFDTISFASDKGDTLTFVKTKTDSSWYCKNQSLVTDYKICYQTIHNTYNTIKGFGLFDVRHSKEIETDILQNQIEFIFNELFFSLTDYRIGTKTGTIFYDSLIVNNKTYFDVTCYYHNFSNSNIGKLYLNKKYGCFKIEDVSNKIIYTLIS